MGLVPKLPLSMTASAEKISAPDTGGLLTHRGWPRRVDASCVGTRWGLGVGRSSIEAPGPSDRPRRPGRPGSHYRGPTTDVVPVGPPSAYELQRVAGRASPGKTERE